MSKCEVSSISWLPIFGLIRRGSDGVMRIVDWVGGNGPKPPIGMYLAADGYTTDINEATGLSLTSGPQGPPGIPGSTGPQGPQGSQGSGGGGGGEGPDWDQIEEYIDEKVEEAKDEILDIIEGGELDPNTLRALVDNIIADHSKILSGITLYQIPTSLTIPYNNAYTALMTYVQPYLDGTKTVIENPVLFQQVFDDYYEAKANIEKEILTRARANEKQGVDTYNVLSRILDFNQVQIFPEQGVIVGGTLAVGTPTYNNAGVTGVTNNGHNSVRFWAGTDYANRETAPFRVLNNGKFWAGLANSGIDFGISTEGALTVKGLIIQDPGGNPGGYNIMRGNYDTNPSVVYYYGNLVKHNGSLWSFDSMTPSNGGIPDESNPNWYLYISSGVGVFRSYVYTRRATPPPTPSGGSYGNPYPDEIIWTDGPPAGTETLWMSSRVFTENGDAPQEAFWKTPSEAIDTLDIDFEWSTVETMNPADVGNPDTAPGLWSNNSANATWMAINKKVGGVWIGWQVLRVKGEDGENGANGPQGDSGRDGYRTEVRYRVGGSWASPPTPPLPGERNPEDWTVGIPPDYDPALLHYLWWIEAEIDMETDEMVSVWSNPPVVATGHPGVQGAQGSQGSQGGSLYTWLKYADSPTSGMSDNPEGKEYMGLAYNKTTPVESTNYSDYTWSKTLGEGVAGPQGPDGIVFYTWVKYADNASGGGMSDSPSGKAYIGLAFNKETPTESTIPGDYQWSKVEGDAGPQGAQGNQGLRGSQGAQGAQGLRGLQGSTGSSGPQGAQGKNPPIVINRDEYKSTEQYKGTANEIHSVIWYNGSQRLVYYTQVTAGTFSGIPPTGHAQSGSKWVPTSLIAESIQTKVLNATTAYIDTLNARRMQIGTIYNAGLPTERFEGTTIGYIPSQPHSDPSNNNHFRIYGKRDYYPSGRLMKYDGYVHSFAYKNTAGVDLTLTGAAEVVWKDEEGSPVFSVFDGTVTGAQFQYTPSSTVSWIEYQRYRMLGGSLGSGATNNQLLAEMCYGNSSMWVPKSNYFCGNVSSYVEVGVMTSGGSSIYEKTETGQPKKYYQSNLTTPIANGWYHLTSFGGTVVTHNPDLGIATATFFIRLIYVNNGILTVTRDISGQPITFDNSQFTMCTGGNLPVIFMSSPI